MRMARKREFGDFLDWEDADGWNLGQMVVEELSGPGEKQSTSILRGTRLNVPIHRLRTWNPVTTKQLVTRPAEYLPGFQDAIKEFARGHEELSKRINEDTEIFVGITGDFGHNEVRGALALRTRRPRTHMAADAECGGNRAGSAAAARHLTVHWGRRARMCWRCQHCSGAGALHATGAGGGAEQAHSAACSRLHRSWRAA